jgi:hypothetical protein
MATQAGVSCPQLIVLDQRAPLARPCTSSLGFRFVQQTGPTQVDLGELHIGNVVLAQQVPVHGQDGVVARGLGQELHLRDRREEERLRRIPRRRAAAREFTHVSARVDRSQHRDGYRWQAWICRRQECVETRKRLYRLLVFEGVASKRLFRLGVDSSRRCGEIGHIAGHARPIDVHTLLHGDDLALRHGRPRDEWHEKRHGNGRKQRSRMLDFATARPLHVRSSGDSKELFVDEITRNHERPEPRHPACKRGLVSVDERRAFGGVYVVIVDRVVRSPDDNEVVARKDVAALRHAAVKILQTRCRFRKTSCPCFGVSFGSGQMRRDPSPVQLTTIASRRPDTWLGDKNVCWFLGTA